MHILIGSYKKKYKPFTTTEINYVLSVRCENHTEKGANVLLSPFSPCPNGRGNHGSWFEDVYISLPCPEMGPHCISHVTRLFSWCFRPIFILFLRWDAESVKVLVSSFLTIRKTHSCLSVTGFWFISTVEMGPYAASALWDLWTYFMASPVKFWKCSMCA